MRNYVELCTSGQQLAGNGIFLDDTSHTDFIRYSDILSTSGQQLVKVNKLNCVDVRIFIM